MRSNEQLVRLIVVGLPDAKLILVHAGLLIVHAILQMFHEMFCENETGLKYLDLFSLVWVIWESKWD